jgi:hypothetical protein
MADDIRHLHDRDFAQWAHLQARALRLGRFNAVDREILANELERMVARERNEINQRLEGLTVQLLMWTMQPAMRTEAFRALITEQRNAIDSLLRGSPSLRPTIESALPKTYSAALDTAEQAGFARTMFPAEPVFSLDQLVDRAFWPASIFGGKAFTF